MRCSQCAAGRVPRWVSNCVPPSRTPNPFWFLRDCQNSELMQKVSLIFSKRSVVGFKFFSRFEVSTFRVSTTYRVHTTAFESYCCIYQVLGECILLNSTRAESLQASVLARAINSFVVSIRCRCCCIRLSGPVLRALFVARLSG